MFTHIISGTAKLTVKMPNPMFVNAINRAESHGGMSHPTKHEKTAAWFSQRAKSVCTECKKRIEVHCSRGKGTYIEFMLWILHLEDGFYT